MRGIFVSRGIGFAAVALLLVVNVSSSNAQAQTATSTGTCWIDVKTGKPVPTVPVGILDGHDQASARDTGDAHNPRTGQSFYRDPSGNWNDAATGQPVPTVPVGILDGHDQASARDTGDAHNPRTGQSFVRVPCPPTTTASSTVGGGYIGGELVKNYGWVRSTERLATTDVITNRFTDTADPVGGGLIVGYKFVPWANNVIVSPFASFDFLHAPVNHTFPGGSYLGTTANFMGTGGVKIGPQLGAGVWLYGIAGVSVLNETLNINFIPVASSSSATVPGATVGLGGAWQPNFLQGFGRPVSLFLEYQHTWWQSANFNTPAASPLFNYSFARQDDVVKFGFTIDLNPAAAQVATGPRYVKALPPK